MTAHIVRREYRFHVDIGKRIGCKCCVFLERVGIDTLRKILVEDSLGICAHLDGEIQKAVDAYSDPWQEADRLKSSRITKEGRRERRRTRPLL